MQTRTSKVSLLSSGDELGAPAFSPEAFPGLVYRMDDPKVVLLLFGSGKMVCVGAREVNDIKNAVRNIKEELSTAGLMRT